MTNSGVTKEFLEKALGYTIEKFEVKAGSNLGEGYTCAMMGVDVWKKSNPEKPISIVIKFYPENESRQEFIEVGNIFQVELGMYNTVIPTLQKFVDTSLGNGKITLPFAPFIFGRYVEREDRGQLGRPLQPLDNIIIMPDLRKPENGLFLMRDRFLGLDLDHHKLVIENQAKLHAISWAYKCKRGLESLVENFPSLENKIGEMSKCLMPFCRANIVTNKKMFQGRENVLNALVHYETIYESLIGLYYDCDMGQDQRGHTKDNILKKPGPVVENEAPWKTLLHGDCWSNNLMFRYDEKTGKPVEVLFIDLQLCRESDPFNDICYALYTSGQADLRRKHLKSLLHVYYDTFTDICKIFDVPFLPGWSWEEFNRRFRRAMVVGGHMALALHIVLKNTDELENLDDGVSKVEISGERKSEKNSKETMGEFFAEMSNSKSNHPAVLPRVTAVLEELIDHGVL